MKFSSIFLLAAGISTLFLTTAAPSHAQSIRVVIDGNLIDFSANPPIEQNGSVLVPLRGVFENLGAGVNYNSHTRTIEAIRGSRDVVLRLGQDTAYVDGQAQPLLQPPLVVYGTTFVPLRFVAEAFGADVNWLGDRQEVQIITLHHHDDDNGSYAQQVPSDIQQNVFNWREIPENETVPVQSATFDENGYQILDSDGETIVVPFAGDNIDTLMFGVSNTGSPYLVNYGDHPVLYLPDNGYLANATVPDARWYPFAEDHPDQPVFLSVAPSRSDYDKMLWYRTMQVHGGYRRNEPQAAPAPSARLSFNIGSVHISAWTGLQQYSHQHSDGAPIGQSNTEYYQWANKPHPARTFQGGGKATPTRSFAATPAELPTTVHLPRSQTSVAASTLSHPTRPAAPVSTNQPSSAANTSRPGSNQPHSATGGAPMPRRIVNKPTGQTFPTTPTHRAQPFGNPMPRPQGRPTQPIGSAKPPMNSRPAVPMSSIRPTVEPHPAFPAANIRPQTEAHPVQPGAVSRPPLQRRPALTPTKPLPTIQTPPLPPSAESHSSILRRAAQPISNVRPPVKTPLGRLAPPVKSIPAPSPTQPVLRTAPNAAQPTPPLSGKKPAPKLAPTAGLTKNPHDQPPKSTPPGT